MTSSAEAGRTEDHRDFVRTEIALLKKTQQTQASDLGELKVSVTTGLQQIQNNLQALSTDFATSRRANWGEYRGWIFGGATVLGMIMSMGGVVLVMFVQNAIGPLTTAAELSERDRTELHAQIRDYAAQAAARGERLTGMEQAMATGTAERAELKARSDRQANGMALQGERITAVERGNIEIETQFKALDNFFSLTRANDLRMLGVLWQRALGQPLPEFFFAPHIAQDHPPG